MIRFLDFLTPFINEVFRVRRREQNARPKGIYKKVLGYALITMSILGNYFLVKKVYELSVQNYRYTLRIESNNELPQQLRECIYQRSVLVDLIDEKLDNYRPITRPESAKDAASTTSKPLKITKNNSKSASANHTSADNKNSVSKTDDTSNLTAIEKHRVQKEKVRERMEKARKEAAQAKKELDSLQSQDPD